MMSKSLGFTIIELMTTLAVVAVLAAISAPSFSEMLRSHRLTTQANLFLSQMHLARSEAVRRGQPVMILSNSSSQDWADGWIIFIDSAFDGEYDQNTDTVLFEQSPLQNDISVQSDSNIDDWIAYLPTGYPTASGNITGSGEFQLCNTDSGSTKILRVNTTGRPEITTSSNPC